MAKISAEKALNGKATFYAKKWQQNNYYPIEKFVWNEEQNGWEEFVQKGGSWHSWGVVFPNKVTYGDGVTNYSWWLYIFQNNSYILSDEEMTDNKHYNLD